MVCIRPTQGEPEGSESQIYLTILEKALARKAGVRVAMSTVPQTNTGARVEQTQAYERTFAKELGNTATVTSG